MADTLDVDFDNTSRYEIETEHGGHFQKLSESCSREIHDLLKGRHEENAINAVLGPLRDWKKSSYANYARTHERVFKQAHGLESAERNSDLLARDPTDSEKEVVKDIENISRQFIKNEYGESIVLYRGITYAIPELFQELFQSTTEDAVSLDTTVLTNFTTVPEVAQSYGTLVIRLEISIDAIALAADQVFGYEINGEQVNPEGEIRVLGDDLDNIEISKIEFPSTRRPFFQSFLTPESMREQEHETVEEIISLIDESEITIKNPNAARALWDWFDIYQSRQGVHGRKRVIAINNILQSITGD